MNAFEEPPPTDDPRLRLVRATIAEIAARGLAHVTVRGIAAAADVNIAAVNYYFGSKDALVTVALETTIANVLEDTEAYLKRLPQSPVEVFGELLAYYLEGGRRYPRIGKAHLHAAFTADDYSGAFPTRFGPVLERLREALGAALPELDEQAAARRIVSALSAVFFPTHFGGLFAPLGALETERDRAEYAREIARRTFAVD